MQLNRKCPSSNALGQYTVLLALQSSVTPAVVHFLVVLVAEVNAEVGVDGAHHVHQPASHEPHLAATLQSMGLFDDSVTRFTG